jgi:predicted 3-demethylubiquinone-9 3-methyltransferase (glyoxalase superfamily)
MSNTITPFLWFDNNLTEALEFYPTVFKDSKILMSSKTPDGSIMTATFILNGQEFYAMNAGPMFKFTEAISFMISCETQEEVDHYWNMLTSNGGEESRCGWLKDRFGLSWQVTPTTLLKLMNDKDKVKAKRVMDAMMTMNKIVIADIEKAYNG